MIEEAPGPAAVVFAGGDRCRPEDLAGLPRDALVIAADSGAEHAVALGWRVDVLVGDLDSVDPALVERLAAGGTTVERHPPAKDATDLALSLDTARAWGAGRVTVVGGHGGRLDHLLANVLLLGSDDYSSMQLDARFGAARVVIGRGARRIDGHRGDLVSLLALGGAAHGVTTGGMLFPLQEATLHPGSSRGVSNELTDSRASLSVARGVVAAVLPGVRGALVDAAESGSL